MFNATQLKLRIRPKSNERLKLLKYYKLGGVGTKCIYELRCVKIKSFEPFFALLMTLHTQPF